jgi:putative endonuclease
VTLSAPAYVYLLRLRSGLLYVGATTDPRTRWRDHCRGRACRTTRLDPPRALLLLEPHPDLGSARRREAQLKGWRADKKEALARGDLQRAQVLATRRKP